MREVSRQLTLCLGSWAPRVGALLLALAIAAHHIPTVVQAASPPPPQESPSSHTQPMDGSHADHSAPTSDTTAHCAEAIFPASPQFGGRDGLPWATLGLVALGQTVQAEIQSARHDLRAEPLYPLTPELLQLFRE